jgi:hypothetical protein
MFDLEEIGHWKTRSLGGEGKRCLRRVHKVLLRVKGEIRL